MTEQNSKMTESLKDYLSELGYTAQYNYFDLITFLNKKNEYASKNVLRVIDTNKTYTYQELFDFVVELSALLSKLDHRTETVCLIGLKDLSFIAANFSIWKANGTAVPLNDLSNDDIQKYNDWISPQVVISGYEITLKNYILEMHERIGDCMLYIYSKIGSSPQKSINLPKEVALIAFTSGTTGPSKGVLLSHENLIAMSIAMSEAIKESSSDNIFVPVSLSHMYGMSVTLTYLLSGKCVSIFQGISTITKALDSAQESHIDAIALQPRHFAEVMENPKLFEMINSYCKFIACASGNLSENDMNIICQKLKTNMYMYYALSEVPRAVFCKNPQLRGGYDIMTIGLPSKFMDLIIKSPRTIHNTENVGEIVLIGSMVAIGYIYQDGKMSFFENKIFYTGDLGYMKHGTYFWYGRMKDIINIHDTIFLNPFFIEKEMLKTGWFKECLLMFDPKINGLKFSIRKTQDAPVGNIIQKKFEEIVGCDFLSANIICQILDVPEIYKNKNGKILRDPSLYP